MDRYEKLQILGEGAKYDVSCSSSGAKGYNASSKIGSTEPSGICHSFTSDGRCISLLKVLLSNECVFDCLYCINRKNNDIRRASFTPMEIAEITMEFYRRNYIEGLFLSSAVVRNPDYTASLILRALEILRYEYGFGGYIHAKIIPGSDEALVDKISLLANRVSVNLEFASQASLKKFSTAKTKKMLLSPMEQISKRTIENKNELMLFRRAPHYAPAGQTTQMIIGASPESDYEILNLTQKLYDRFSLKRVYFSAYIPVNANSLLPSTDSKPPLLREHRLYQADWLLRFYGFRAEEILDEENPMFNLFLDPKCNWAVKHYSIFPMEINKAEPEMLLRVPGIGPKNVERILMARRVRNLDFETLKKIGVVLKRAKYFILCDGKSMAPMKFDINDVIASLVSRQTIKTVFEERNHQIPLFEEREKDEGIKKCLPQVM